MRRIHHAEVETNTAVRQPGAPDRDVTIGDRGAAGGGQGPGIPRPTVRLRRVVQDCRKALWAMDEAGFTVLVLVEHE